MKRLIFLICILLLIIPIVNAEELNILERLTNAYNFPVMANVSFNTFENNTDNDGYYFFKIPSGFYNITFDIPHMIINNFWLKLFDVDVSSTKYNKLIHVTNYSLENKISLVFNITNNQTIQVYSPSAPNNLSIDGKKLTQYSGISDLTNNYGWYYDNETRILHVSFNGTPELPSPIAKYNLSVNSIPSGIVFTLNDTSLLSNWTGLLDEGSYAVTMPSINGSYQFVNWTDGSTNPIKTVNLISNTTITANFELLEATPDPLIMEIIEKINESEIYNTTYALQNISSYFSNRSYGYNGNVEAATYIFNRFSNITRLNVEYQGTYNNVIATLPGTNLSSSKIYMVGAHYDTVNLAFAPGATDNGAGVAIVLELARIMSQYNFSHTIKFAAWNREEGGSLGSTEYVDYAVNNKLNISLYFNYDSTCHDPDNRFILDIMNNSKSAGIASMMTDYNTLYGLDFNLTYNVHSCGSDYQHFWAHGYTAVMTHQENHNFQHSAQDTIDKVNLVYARKNAQMGMSVIAELAEVQSLI